MKVVLNKVFHTRSNCDWRTFEKCPTSIIQLNHKTNKIPIILITNNWLTSNKIVINERLMNVAVWWGFFINILRNTRSWRLKRNWKWLLFISHLKIEGIFFSSRHTVLSCKSNKMLINKVFITEWNSDWRMNISIPSYYDCINRICLYQAHKRMCFSIWRRCAKWTFRIGRSSRTAALKLVWRHPPGR